MRGYHTDDDADDLSVELLLTAVFGKESFASQPTVSRFNKKANIVTVKSLERVTEVLQRHVYAIKPQTQFLVNSKLITINLRRFVHCGMILLIYMQRHTPIKADAPTNPI